MRFQTNFQVKANIIEPQFSQWFFTLGTACFFNRFLGKKQTKREISSPFWYYYGIWTPKIPLLDLPWLRIVCSIPTHT